MHLLLAAIQIALCFLRIELADGLIATRILAKVVAFGEDWLLFMVVAQVQLVTAEILFAGCTS